MSNATFTLIKLALDTVTTFVPLKKYKARAAAATEDTKNAPDFTDSELYRGWERREVCSADGSFIHRYYEHPSARADAPTLLMLHGLVLDGRSCFNLRSLAEDSRLITYDFPETWAGYQGKMSDFIELLDDFVDVLKLDTFSLAGVSFGGMVAIRWTATLPPNRLRSLILIATRIPGYTKEQRRQSREAQAIVERYADYRLFWVQEKAEKLYLRRFKGDDRARMAEVLRPKSIDFYRQATMALVGCDGGEDARKISAPVLYLLGTKDEMIPQESAEEIQEAIPNARIERISGEGHVMTYLRGDKIAKRISTFLSAQG